MLCYMWTGVMLLTVAPELSNIVTHLILPARHALWRGVTLSHVARFTLSPSEMSCLSLSSSPR